MKVKKVPQGYQQRFNNKGEQTTYNHRVAQAHQELQQFFEKFDCKDDSDSKDGRNSILYNHVKRPKKYDNMFPSSSEDSRNGESCLNKNIFGESKFDEGDGANKIIIKGNDIKFKPDQQISKYELEQLAQERLNEY